MNRGPYFWTIERALSEAHDTITLVFNTGGKNFQFFAGQFINLTMVIGGETISRSYSLSSPPSDPRPAITVKRVPQGIMSNYLIDHWREIDAIKVEGPFGNFILPAQLPEETELVFLAGGSGISPIYSLLRHESRSSRKMHLIDANRTAGDVIFSDGLSQLAASTNLQLVHALSADTAREIFPAARMIRGRLSRLVVKKLLRECVPKLSEAYYFVCGPQGLNALYLDALESLGIPESQIITESFNQPPVEVPVLVQQDRTFDVLINWQEDGSIYSEEVDDKVVSISSLIPVLPGDTILKAALREGLPLRASCSSGTCGTCWARCTSGAVKMLQNYALTEADVRDHQILLCQSVPLDNGVTIDVMLK